jgi:hypothetical protein
MCWVSNNPAIFKIAEQDIKTFKVLRIGQHGDLYSYFFYSTYPIGEIKPEVILYSEEKSFCKYFIYRGYHSYDKSIECKYYCDCREDCGIVKVGNLETYCTN